MSSRRNTSTPNVSLPVWLIATAASASFAVGLGTATYLLRLRDRERLRHAASRTKESLRQSLSQKAKLGPQLPWLSSLFQGKKARTKIIVVGAGSYGTAMAFTAAINGHDVVLCMRDSKQCECINKEHYNPKYLSEYNLAPDGNAIRGICTDEELRAEMQGDPANTVIILALPCQLTPDWIRAHRDIPTETLVCSTAKGLYLKTQQLIGHAILDALDRPQDEQPLVFLSGPGFSKFIMERHPTSVVVASDRLPNAVRMQTLMSNTSFFRCYTSTDVIGVQLGGALKNPLAIGAGMIDGLSLGINTLSACVTRASRELCELCIAMGGDPLTITGLSGIGDLMLTCFSDESRNQRCGRRLIQGESIADIQKDFTVEGVATADVAIVYAELCGLELPLFRTVHALIHRELSPDEAVAQLMGRPLVHETTSVSAGITVGITH